MNTNLIKTFAQNARNILLPNINQRLRYWGFDEKGNYTKTIIIVQGGYMFRGEVYTDTTVPDKLERLSTKINNAQSFKDICEEAAYTWFNRLMAIKILEKNNYESPILQYAEGTNTPLLLQNAKRGNFPFVEQSSQALLKDYLQNSQDEEAFALLLTHYCNQHQMLSAVFGKINDYTEILTPMNLLISNGLIQLLNATDAISDDDYKAVELIGWLYQFYISDRKDEVFANFKKNKKARAEDIPAATQIFTPKWIVQYMVENTLGKLYLDYSEEDDNLQKSLNYFVQNQQTTTPAALINDISELRILDPACGSGHILVVAFDLLMKIYIQEGYDSKTAAQKILTQHLYGLDIDDRAAQLANFAVRLKAAQYDKKLLTTNLTVPILAFPEARTFDADAIAFLLGETAKNLTFKIETALNILQQGKNLGAVTRLDFTAAEQQQLKNQWQNLQYAYTNQHLSFSETQHYEGLQPFLSVLLILTDRFPAVVANPPYMGNGSMNADLKKYLEKNYPYSKSDLFAVFMERMKAFACENGLVGNVTMESWMFLSSYEKLRKKLLSEITFTSLSHFGWHIMGIAFGTVAFTYKNKVYTDEIATYNYLEFEDINKKTQTPFVFPLKTKRFALIPQINFNKIPGSPIAYWVSERIAEIFEEEKKAKDYGKGVKGLDTGDDSRFLKVWWEPSINNTTIFNKKIKIEKWFPYNKGGAFRKWYGNKSYVVDWENDGFEIINFKDAKGKLRSRPQNIRYYFRKGIEWSRVSSYKIGLRSMSEAVFGGASQAYFIEDNEINHNYILALFNTNIVSDILKILNPTLIFQGGDINKIPIKQSDIQNQEINLLTQTNIDLSKTDWDSRETSWDFAQSPLIAVQGEDLTAAYEKWAAQVTADFYQLHENEEELNRIFIDIYGLQDELTPEVPLKDITILQEELDRKALDKINIGDALPIDKGEVVRQLVSYCIGCAMGRYHLGKTGLHIAHQQASPEETAPYTLYNTFDEKQNFTIDEDGILPLLGQQSPFPDDMVKFVTIIIEKLWGQDSLMSNLNFIDKALGTTLEEYLRNPNKGFWKYHTRQYKKRPIYWLFASSQKGEPAFQVLAYLHRMDKYTVQKIRTKYLHPYQAALADKIEKAKADPYFPPKDLDKLEQVALECRNYDETLKSLENQQIELDLDNGVEENYKLFGKAVRGI